MAFSTSEDSSGPLSSNQLLGFREGNAHISGRDARAHSHLPAVMAPDVSHADGAFAECHELIEEMRRIYSTDEDAVKVRQLTAEEEEVAEECVMSSVDISQFGQDKGGTGQHDDDSDEEGGPGGGQKVQCQNM